MLWAVLFAFPVLCNQPASEVHWGPVAVAGVVGAVLGAGCGLVIAFVKGSKIERR
jgi:hypothetical protein